MSSRAPDWVTETLASLPALLTADETAQVLRCSRRSISRLLSDGRLSGLKNTPGGSGKVLIPKSELGKYLSSLGAA